MLRLFMYENAVTTHMSIKYMAIKLEMLFRKIKAKLR